MKDKKMSDFPYLSLEAVDYLKNTLGINIFITNTPSFDNQSSKDLENHRVVFKNSDETSLIIEMIDSTSLSVGLYILDLGIYPTDQDSFPIVIKT